MKKIEKEVRDYVADQLDTDAARQTNEARRRYLKGAAREVRTGKRPRRRI